MFFVNLDETMDVQMNGRRDKRTAERTEGKTDERTKILTNGQTRGRQMDGHCEDGSHGKRTRQIMTTFGENMGVTKC